MGEKLYFRNAFRQMIPVVPLPKGKDHRVRVRVTESSSSYFRGETFYCWQNQIVVKVGTENGLVKVRQANPEELLDAWDKSHLTT